MGGRGSTGAGPGEKDSPWGSEGARPGPEAPTGSGSERLNPEKPGTRRGPLLAAAGGNPHTGLVTTGRVRAGGSAPARSLAAEGGFEERAGQLPGRGRCQRLQERELQADSIAGLGLGRGPGGDGTSRPGT